MASQVFGEGDFRYELVEGWGALPEGWTLPDVCSVAIDGDDNVYLAGRGELSIEKLKIFEVQKYVTHTSHMYGPLPLFYSKKLFDQLSPDEQAVLKECAAKGRDVQRGINKQMDDATIESLRAKGIKVNELSDDERQRMREKTKVVYTDFKDKIGPAIVDLAQQQLTRDT